MDIVFAALGFEIGEILKISKAKKKYQDRRLRLYEGMFKDRSFLFAVMGMGQDNASFAFKTVCRNYIRPKKTSSRVYLFGFCVVSEPLKIGDIVLYQSLSCQDDGVLKRIDVRYPPEVVSWVQKSADHAGIGVHLLDAETVPQVISSRHHHASKAPRREDPAFDMESFFLAEAAEAASVGLIVLRAISDNKEHPIPKTMADLGSDQTLLSFLRFVVDLFRSPKNLILFCQALRHFKKARSSLLLAFKGLFDDVRRD